MLVDSMEAAEVVMKADDIDKLLVAADNMADDDSDEESEDAEMENEGEEDSEEEMEESDGDSEVRFTQSGIFSV